MRKEALIDKIMNTYYHFCLISVPRNNMKPRLGYPNVEADTGGSCCEFVIAGRRYHRGLLGIEGG